MNEANVEVKSHSKYYGPLMMLGASLCFAGGGAVIKLIPWNALAINGSRNLLAAMVIGIFILITKHRLKFNLTVFMGALCMFGVTTCFIFANKMTAAGNAIILQFTSPIWIILMMALFFKKKPVKGQVITLVVVFVGIICFFFDSLSSGHLAGDVIAIISGIFYAGLFILNQFEKGDALSSMFFGQLACGLCLTPLAFRETDFSAPVIGGILFLGLIQVGVAYIFFSEGTRYTHPVTASLINAVEPVLNPVLVAIVWGEMLTPLAMVGALIVVIAVCAYNIIFRDKNEN